MKKLLLILAVVCCSSLMASASDDTLTLRATLRGDNEVPPINTPATGDFTATQNADGTFNFTLNFANLKAPLVVAHFHFAPKHVAGNVMIFLCGGDSQPPCPSATSGTITGTFGPANVVCTGCSPTNPAGQGIAAGDFASALEAILEGNSYVNMHSVPPTGFPGGEIRGQVRASRDDDDK